jgi:hypothetical protein
LEKDGIMSCCSPEYRKAVAEKEKRINHNSKDSLTLKAKVVIILIMTGTLITTVLVK